MTATPWPSVLAYHKVGTAELGGTWCTRRQFRRHLQGLADAGVRAIGLDTFADRIAGSTPPPTAPVEVLVTFDDAFAAFAADALPELVHAGVPSVLFVPVDCVGRRADWDWPLPGRRIAHLDWPALRAVAAAGVTIGAHGATHCDLRRLDDRALARELHGARRRLQDELGVPVRAVAYPFGRSDARVEAATEDAGYDLGFAMASPDAAKPRRFRLPRHGVYVIDGVHAVLDKVDPLRPGHALQARLERGIGACSALVSRLQRIQSAG